MATDRIHDELVAFVCGELDESDRARLQTALQADPEMAAEARQLAEALLAVTPSEPACVGEDFNSKLRERVEKEGLAQRGAAGHLRWRRAVPLKAGLAMAAAAVVIAAGLWMLLAPGGAGGVAFAVVQRQIEQAQTMTLTATAEMKVMEALVKTKMKMYFKSPGLMRQEFTVENATTALGTTQTATAPAVQGVSIFDIPNQKGITLLPDQKKAVVLEFKNFPAERMAKEQNFLDELKKAVAGEHEELGEKTVNGQKAKGYRCKSGMKVTMDIWVDPLTGKPILVEQALPEGMGKVTMTDFVLNPDLDDALFDTKVPEGYSTETQTVDFNIQNQLTKGLSLLAKYGGGVFPKSLVPTPELREQIKKAKMSQEESKEFAMCMGVLWAFQAMMTQQGAEFTYAGEGVRLGDKATPILWYKAKNAKAYRVIYGDLHAEDAETAPQQPATQPSASGAAVGQAGPKPPGGESH